MQLGEERFNGDDIRRLYESTSYPRRRRMRKSGRVLQAISTEKVVADSATCTARTDNTNRAYLTLRLVADSLPRLLSISYSTVCPSLSERSPARSTAEM